MTRPTKSLTATLLITLLAVVGCGEDKKAPTPAAGGPAPAASQQAPAASRKSVRTARRPGGDRGGGRCAPGQHQCQQPHQTVFQQPGPGTVQDQQCRVPVREDWRTVQLHGRRNQQSTQSLQVGSEDFNAMMETIGKTLDEKSVAEADKKELMDLMASYKAEIVSSVPPESTDAPRAVRAVSKGPALNPTVAADWRSRSADGTNARRSRASPGTSRSERPGRGAAARTADP